MLGRFLSHFFPKTIEVVQSKYSGRLEVEMMNGKLMLNTTQVNYAFGKLDAVWRSAFNQTKINDRNYKNILILGLGPGNIPTILNSRKNIYQITGVEIDNEVIRLGKKYFGLDEHENLEIVQEDALNFVNESKQKFDLICIDLFIDDVVPAFAEEIDFLSLLSAKLNPSGMIQFNCLMHTPALAKKTEEFTKKLQSAFPGLRSIKADLNRILILEAKP